MSYTKGEIVHGALAEIGLAEYEFDISPEEIVAGIRRLDSMMASWSDSGIVASYPLTNLYDSAAIDENSNIPDVAREAVITNLALRLAPSYGKQISPDLRVAAKSSLNTLMRFYSRPVERQLPSMPAGAGYKATEYNRFTPPPSDKYVEDVSDTIDLSGGPDA